MGKWSNLKNIFFKWVGSTTNQIVNCHFFLGPSPSVLRDGVVRRSVDCFLARMRSHCVRSRKLGWRRIWILPRVFAAVGESYWKIHVALFSWWFLLFPTSVFITMKSPIWAKFLAIKQANLWSVVILDVSQFLWQMNVVFGIHTKKLGFAYFLFCTLGFITIFHHHLGGHIFGSPFSNRRAEANPREVSKSRCFFFETSSWEWSFVTQGVPFTEKSASLKLTLEVQSTRKAEQFCWNLLMT